MDICSKHTAFPRDTPGQWDFFYILFLVFFIFSRVFRVVESAVFRVQGPCRSCHGSPGSPHELYLVCKQMLHDSSASCSSCLPHGHNLSLDASEGVCHTPSCHPHTHSLSLGAMEGVRCPPRHPRGHSLASDASEGVQACQLVAPPRSQLVLGRVGRHWPSLSATPTATAWPRTCRKA